MDQFTNEELLELIRKATAGDRKALETVLVSVQDLVFNLSLRMLGTFPDAEDATQDILLKIMTHLSSFRGESAFSTWVFRIASNYLKSYQKHMFAKFPLSFAYYGDDIKNADIRDVPDLTQNVEQAVLAEELKLSCSSAWTPKAAASSSWAPCSAWTAGSPGTSWASRRRHTASACPGSAAKWRIS